MCADYLISSVALNMSLWDLAKERLNENARKMQVADESQTTDDDNATREDSYIILFGSKNCGKTSLILRFLDRDEQAKPTIALEYTYGRRSKGNNKEVGHIWELAGGASLSNLLDVPINNTSLETLSLVLMLDISKPEELWTTLETYLKEIRKRLDVLFDKNKQLKDKLLAKTWSKIGVDHPEKEFLNPLPIPFAIVGAKYDLFQELESEKRKTICKTLRFIAHTNGATLQFFSLKNESLVTRGRALISHFIFGTASSKGIATDHNKPLFVPAGSDSVSDIGPPTLAEGERMSGGTPYDLWKSSFCGIFPQITTAKELPKNPRSDPQFKEEVINLLRDQKDKDLETYIKQRDRENLMTEIKQED